MQKKILFWICNFPNSIGEVTNTFLFSKGLDVNKYSIFFYAENKSKAYLQSLECNNILNKEEVLKNNFDLIIFSEYYRFIRLMKLGEYNDIEKLISLIKNTKKIATFDTLSLGNTKESINNRLEEIPYLKTIYSDELISDIEFFCIKTCPINNPNQKAEKSFYWSLPILEKNEKQISDIKKVMGCTNEGKIILFSLSSWQYYSFEETSRLFFIIFVNYIANLLKKLDKEIYFIVVSPTELLKTNTSDNLSTIVFNIGQTNLLQPNFYEQLILSSDLILTTNFIQHSFVRAVNSGVCGLNLKGGIKLPNSSYGVEAFSFLASLEANMFLNMNKIYLKTNKIFENSIYIDLFEDVEFTKEKEFLDILNKILYNQDYIKERKNKYNIFKEQLKILPSENEIIDKILYS